MQQPTISRSTRRGAIDTTYRHQNQDLDIVPAYLPKPSSRVWIIRDQDGVQYAGRQDMVDLIQQMERKLRGIHTFPKASCLPRDLQVHPYMTEKHALQVFLQSLTVEQLRLILQMFKTRCLISEEIYDYCCDLFLLKRDITIENFQFLIQHLLNRCTYGLAYIVYVMHHFGHVELAYQLYNIYLNLNISPMIVHKIDASSRKKIQNYFEVMKTNIQYMVFKDPFNFFKKLSVHFRQKIADIHPSSTKFAVLCDKYVVLLALTMDTLVNKTIEISPDDQVFHDMERFAAMTLCPDLSRCMLYGRRAVVLSFANKKGEGEELVKEALVCAHRVSACLETVDLLYKIVLFLRVWYEHFPQITTNAIYDHYRMAMQILENEPDDRREVWAMKFTFRLLCCFLGLGMHCRFIKHFNCTNNVKTESERLLKKYQSSETGLRLKMYFSIAKSRLHHLKGDTDTALEHILLAKEIAMKGKYVELKTILESEQTLYLSDAAPLFVEEESSDSDNIVSHCIPEPIQLPNSWNPNSFQSPKKSVCRIDKFF